MRYYLLEIDDVTEKYKLRWQLETYADLLPI